MLCSFPSSSLFAAVAASLLATVAGTPVPTLSNARAQISKRDAVDPTMRGTAYFEQPIDPTDPSCGTFSQLYAYNYQYWGGPGSPIIFTTAGETNLTASTPEGLDTIVGLNQTWTVLAQEVGGAVINIEHRYWGESLPAFEDYNATALQYLTVENAIADFTNFANNVVFPFDESNSSQATNVPWVFIGGSYSGALPAWTEQTSPDIFWAYWASSAPVQGIEDFWNYDTPQIEHAPKNCSADLQAVIAHIDDVLINGSESDKDALKARFNATGVSDIEAAGNLILPASAWQYVEYFNVAVDSPSYFTFCDMVETANYTVQASDAGVGLEGAMTGYAAWLEGPDAAHIEESSAIESQGIQGWSWLLCNEPLYWFQEAAPAGQPRIRSSLLDREYWYSTMCDQFGTAGVDFNINNYTIEQQNEWTSGWNDVNRTRVLFVNGEWDPWLDSGVSSNQRPGGPMASTTQTPVSVVPRGSHCSDLTYIPEAMTDDIKTVIDSNLDIMKAWVDEWYMQTGTQASAGSKGSVGNYITSGIGG